MIRVFFLALLTFCLSDMDTLSAQSIAMGASGEARWNGRKATLTLDDDSETAMNGEIVRMASNGVVFKPEGVGVRNDTSERFYPFAEIEELITNEEEVVYRSGQTVMDLSEYLLADEIESVMEGESAMDSSFIILNDGEVLHGNVALKSKFLGSDYLLFDDSSKYELKEVKAFQSEGEYFVRVQHGLFSQTKLAMRVQRGNIDLYAFYEHTPMPMLSGPSVGPVNTWVGPGVANRVDYFSKDGSYIKKANYGNLKRALFDNAESMKYLNQHRTLTYTQIGLAVAGIGVVVASLATLEKGDDPPPGIFVGLGLAVGSWIPYFARKGLLDKAIEAYNRE